MDSDRAQAQTKRILLVEDDILIRQLYSRALQNEGYIVDVAEDGNKAYEAMHKGGYDLVLLDIMLPFMDGLAILKKLSESPPESPNKNIMLLTNLDQKIAMAKGEQYGIRGYLVKSEFDLPQLRAEIKAVFENV